MLFETKIATSERQAFTDKVSAISTRLGIQPDWLMSVMFFESGLDKKKENPVTGAYGFIQMMPETYQGYGLKAADFYVLPAVRQLDFVEKYLNFAKGKMKSFTDVYLAVFFPKAMREKDSYVLQTEKLKAGTIAIQNAPFDTNKNGQITVGEIKNFLKTYFNKHLNGSELKILFPTKNVIVGILLSGIIFFVGYKLMTKHERK
jgi:hypothetical protein